jgi:NADPH2:quinone reductase
LLGGGGYAGYATVAASHCLPVPVSISLTAAAALPEAIVTVYANLFEDAALHAGEIVLIHGGASGIGTTAIQMAKGLGATVFTTTGSDEKGMVCRDLGSEFNVNYHLQDFAQAIAEFTATFAAGPGFATGHGVDVILDMVGGDNVARNLSILAPRGRHISIATQGGAQAEIDLRLVMQKRLTLTGSTLRGRDRAEKTRLINQVEQKFWPWVAAGTVKPVLFQTFPLKNAAEAHKVMESGAHIGKMVLEVSDH